MYASAEVELEEERVALNRGRAEAVRDRPAATAEEKSDADAASVEGRLKAMAASELEEVVR